MPICKFCGIPFAWGNSDGKWVPLMPVEDHEGYDRAFQDENGVLRAKHSLVCVQVGGPSVRVAPLARVVKAEEIIEPRSLKRRRGPKKKGYEG